jgi:hypothetical protein
LILTQHGRSLVTSAARTRTSGISGKRSRAASHRSEDAPTGRNLNGAAGDVVADRVVEQVRDQARNEAWVADRDSLVEGCVDLNAVALCIRAATVDDVLRQLSEVELLPGLDAAFAGGERQQRVDQPRLLAGSCSASSHVERRASASASGSASATCSSVRWPASGVRRSWEALATN